LAFEKNIVWTDRENCVVDWPETIRLLNTRDGSLATIESDYIFEQRNDGWYAKDHLGLTEIGPYYNKSEAVNAIRQTLVK